MSGKNILLGVIVLLILYFVYIYVFKDSSSTNLYSGGNAKNAKEIKASKLPGNPASVSYTYSIWIYVNSWQYRYGQTKTIFYRSATATPNPSTVLPELSLGGSKNDLGITIGLQGGQSEQWTINNIPLQKWVNVIVSLDSKILDIYINGKLVKTCVTGEPKIYSGDNGVKLTDNGGFSGYTSKFRYFPNSMNPQTAWNTYQQGWSETNIFGLNAAYDVDLIVTKNGKKIF